MGANHHVVVARWPLSNDVSATTNVDVHAAAISAFWSAHLRRRVPASRTSGRAKASPSASGILAPNAGTITASGFAVPPATIVGTDKPCAVRTLRRTPISDTSKRVAVIPAELA